APSRGRPRPGHRVTLPPAGDGGSAWRRGLERAPLVLTSALHRQGARLQELVPGAGKVGEGLGNHYALPVTQDLQTRVLGMKLPYRASVGGREQRARSAFGRIAHGPQALAVADTDAGLDGVVDAPPRGGVLDEADGALECTQRVIFKAIAEGQIE